MFPALFSLSTAGIMLLATLLRPVRAPCPPVFFAQAISHRQMRQMDFYFTKSGIASAADCANLCGQRHFCQSAVFNHDARSCALSPARPVDCRMVKHRFNTFHLTTDGADALSLLACIHPCQGRQEKLQDQQNGGGGGGFSHLLNIDLGPEGRDSGDPSRKRHREQELFPSPDILPVHDEAGPLVEKQKSGRDEALKKSESGFLGALERLYQMQRRLEEILNEAQRSGHGNGKEGDAKAGPPEEAKKVRFRAEPLKLTGEFDPIAPEAPNIIPLPAANFSVSSGQLTQTHTLQNGTQVRVHSAGFLARLKPGGRLKLLTAGPGPGFDSSDAGQSAPKQLVQLGRTLAMEIPAQLVTMAPDLFETTASEPASSSAAPFDRNELGGGEAEEPRVSNGRLLGPEAGFLHSLLIHHGKGEKEQGREGERGGETEDEKEQLQKEALSIDAAAPRHSPPSTVVCFRFVQHRRLLHDSGAEIRSERNFSLNQCRCACADTWREGQGRKCKSVRFSHAEGICQLVEADHNQKLDLVVDRSSDYHYVSCELKYLLRTAEKMCKADTQSKGKESGKEADEATTEPTAFVVVNSSTSGAEATTSSVGTPASSRASPPGANLPAELDQNNHSLEANASGCFERMAGFSLRGTAAGLERDVSQAECECLCANSLRSRMYSFQCVSANYFPADRDCVLNLDSRHSAIEQFGSDQQVTYLGLMCTPEMASQQLAACAWPPTQTNSTSSPSPPPPSDTSAIAADNSSGSSPAVPPSLSDGCFLEQPGFVLEGLALAVETQVSAAQCKCRCALAERRHGSAVCQSAQFYTESRTCLLNKENRASAPERFSFDSQGADKHSYLDFRCGADKPTLAGYLEANCKEEMAQLSGDDVGMETTTQSAGTETETTTAQLKLLSKGKRRKGRKKGDSTADSATTSASTTAAATEMAPITDPTTPAASTTNRKSAEDESEEESQQLETRTSVPSSQNVEELSIIPERESSDDAEEHALPGWRTVRVQRGDEPQQVQAVPAAPPAIAAQQQRDDRPESGKEKTATPTQPPTTVGGASSTTSATPNISTAAASLSVSAAASNANSSNATSPASSSSSSSFTSTTTTTTTTTTSSEYPPVGQCRFSALYQTVFNGARLLKRLLVDTPAQCLAACHFESCRSANLIQMEDKQKVCELFRDSIVEFRRTDVLSFDRLAVHFDSVQCKPRTE